jgi:hypothetical protein
MAYTPNWDDLDDEDPDENSMDSGLDDIQSLLDEGLEPRKPKRNMNPKSIANLRQGGIETNIKKDKLSKRDEEIDRRVIEMAEDPIEYYKKALMRNLIKEEINLEELQADLVNESAKSNQQKIRAMIYSNTQTFLLIGDAMKVQAKQNKVEDKKSVSAMSQVAEEFRKTLSPEEANNPDLLRAAIEQMRKDVESSLARGDTH